MYLHTKEGGGGLFYKKKTPIFFFPDNFTDDIAVPALASYCRADVEKISAVRRGNYEYLQSRLRNIKPFFAALPKEVVPMNFPIIVEGMDRNVFYFKLQEKGVSTSTLYYKLVDQITESEYPISYQVSRYISNLPIHQGITHADIDTTLEAVRAVFAGEI